REEMVHGLNGKLESYAAMRSVEVPNSVVPAIRFDPVVPGVRPPTAVKAGRRARRSDPGRVTRPANLEEVAFWPVTKLSELIRTRQVTSLELTEMYLDRLERYGPQLECVVTLTKERALEQARRADEEIRAGRYRGPLPAGGGWMKRARSSSRSLRSARSPWATSGSAGRRATRGTSSRARAARRPGRPRRPSRGSSGSASGLRRWGRSSRHRRAAGR